MCTVDGCEAGAWAKGLCTKHYQRLRSTGRVDQPPCAACGGDIKGAEKRKKFCSEVCRYNYRKRDYEIIAASCPECAAAFTPWRRGVKFCSRKCQKAAGDRASTAIRRARTRGAKSERFDPLEVLVRDRWVCQLCGVKTLKAKRGTSDLRAPVIDHIVPLALGGEHSRQNTQCACHGCNAAKGAKAYGQLRMFA